MVRCIRRGIDPSHPLPTKSNTNTQIRECTCTEKEIRTRDPTVRAVEGMTHPVSYDQHYSKSYGTIWWRGYVKHIAKTGTTKLSSYIKNKKMQENFPEFTRIRKARVNKLDGCYSVTFMSASMRHHILVRYRRFGGTYCRRQGVTRREQSPDSSSWCFQFSQFFITYKESCV